MPGYFIREVIAAGLNAAAAPPDYAAAYRRAWRAQRRGVNSPSSDERIWVSPTRAIFRALVPHPHPRRDTAGHTLHQAATATASRWTSSQPL